MTTRAATSVVGIFLLGFLGITSEGIGLESHRGNAGAAQGGPTHSASHPQVVRDDVAFHLAPTPDALREAFDARELELLEKLNRADVEHLARLDTLVLPDRWDRDPLDYSPLPREVAELDTVARALVVHQPTQVFGAYEDGRLVRWGPVSTGRREHPTPSGRFHLTWRSEGRHSTVNPEWYLEWYYNFHNERGLSFHQYALPGEPASHACVRLLERDARWIYEWGEGWVLDERGWEVLETGTPVWILDEYDYDEPPPWLDSDDPHPRVELESHQLASPEQ